MSWMLVGIAAWYAALAMAYRRIEGESVFAAVRRNWLPLAALAVVWTPACLALAYWWVTGRSALTLLGG